jgi:phage-related protein
MAERKSSGVLTRLVGRRWRDYETAAGRRPVKEFLAELSDSDAAEVLAAMQEITRDGLRTARHLRGDIWEVRANGQCEAFRVLFAPEGRKGRILLALEGFSKKDQKTPPHLIDLAEQRLSEWRQRGRRATK